MDIQQSTTTESNVNNHLLSGEDWRVKGDDAITKGDYEKAIHCYSEAIDLVPTNHLYFICRSAAYIHNNDNTKALGDAEKCINLNPSWEAGYDQKGKALYELGNFDSSIKAYKQGLGVEPNSALLKKGLASVKRIVQKYSCPSPASMLDAARTGDLAGIKALLHMGCGVNYSIKTTNGLETPLGAAMSYGRVEAMKLLLAAGADVNINLNQGKQHASIMSPVHVAVKLGHAGMVELLIKAGASVHERTDEDQETLLHTAVKKGHVEVVRVLLAAGARVDALTKTHRIRPIGIAVENGHTGIVELLIKAGASVQEPIDEGLHTLLHFAAARGRVEVARVLLAAGARLDALTKPSRLLPITVAANHGQAGMVELLLKAGASVHEPVDEDGVTLLHAAAAVGGVEVVRVLLAAGARVDAVTTDDGKLPIVFAVTKGHVEVVKLLMKAGSSVDARSDDGLALLHCAAISGKVEVARLLVAAGARVDAPNNDGFTPLFFAAYQCHDEVVEVLVEAGAAVDARERTKQPTPLIGCLTSGECLSKPVAARKTAQLLIKAGADVNAGAPSGLGGRLGTLTTCVLQFAAMACCPGIVQDLLNAGAREDKGSTDVSSWVGRVPLEQFAKNEKLLNSAEWKQRMADTKAVFKRWKKTQKQAKQVGRGGAGAGASPGDCLIVRAKDGQCGKVRENGEKKKKKKRAVKYENRVCDGPDCNSLGVNRCKACKRPAYCSVECQRAHWNAGHKQECKMWRE